MGSYPTATASGMKTGSVINKIDTASINIPKTSKTPNITNTTTMGGISNRVDQVMNPLVAPEKAKI